MVKRKLGFEGAPWIENCLPHNLEELAVQKKKVSEVEEWLRNSFKQQKKASILLLTGPPGAGKTATVLLLCKLLKSELFSWSNADPETPQNSIDDFSSLNFERKWPSKKENQVSQFSSFILRCNKYSLFAEDKKVILVEEFPNSFLRNPSPFHDILRKYTMTGRHPLVFIISDDTKGESIESRLFPNDLKFSLKVTNISFNPVTQARVLKVLNKINDTAQFQSCYAKISKTQLEDIAANSMGDIRNAINSLHFLSMSNFKKTKMFSRANSTTEKAKSQENQRDSSLFLFHALGKILYCKRDASAKGETDILPSHMKHLERDPPLANAEDVFERTSLSAEAFSLFLQENFLAFTNDINAAADCLHWFSESDILSSYWSVENSLSEYAASLASRGLMFNMGPTIGNTWRPLHKPHYYDSIKKQNSLMASLRHSFRDKCLTFRELQIEVIPFMQKINCVNLKPGQSSIVSEAGEMKVKRYFRPEYQTLKEKEVPDIEIEDCEIAPDPSDTKNDSFDPLEAPRDEDIVIEEYDFF